MTLGLPINGNYIMIVTVVFTALLAVAIPGPCCLRPGTSRAFQRMRGRMKVKKNDHLGRYAGSG